ncbi:MAG: alpha/beta fold hydrolase [Rhodopirellula sp.]|nr:alpha/beta fold hydrolase [Rhodopirellula sp.]
MRRLLFVTVTLAVIGILLATTVVEGIAQETAQSSTGGLPVIGDRSRETPLPNGSERSSPGQFVELVIPLDEKQTYSLRGFCLECNRKLGTDYALDVITDRRIQLTPQEQRLLRLLARPELLGEDVSVDLQNDRLVLRLPNPQSSEARQDWRRRIESLLGIRVPDWPAGKGLHLPENFDPQRRSVLLIHGLEASLTDLQGLSRACQRSGLQTLLFDYPNDGPVAVSGRRLHAELTQLAQQNPQLRIAIVAHSMGGLVAREALENGRPALTCVTDVFLLGTPHRGSALSRGQPWLELVFQSDAESSAAWASVRDGLGEAAQDLKPGSFFLQTLDARRRPAGMRYHVAIGTRGFVDARRLAELRRSLDERLQLRGASDLQRARLAGFLDQADALCTGQGDGAVTIDSARLPGADSQRMFDLSHIELLQVPEKKPESSPVFQWILETLRSQK